MSDSIPHFENASDIEKGHGLTLDTSALSTGSPVQQASNDPLSPTFGATYSPRVSPGPFTNPASMQNISNLNLGGAPSIHQLTSPTIPHLSLDAVDTTVLPAPRPPISHTVSSPLAFVIPTLPHTDSKDASSLEDEKKIAKEQAIDEKAMIQLETKGEVQHLEVASKPAAPAPTPIVAGRWVKFILFFNCYRRFFTFVVTLNAVGIIMAALDRFPYAENNTGAFILGNLCTAVLMRNEIFGRFLYLIVNTCLRKWPPLFIRLGATSALQHLGGIHSGCALSGTGWLIFRVVTLIANAPRQNKAVIATGVITNIAIIVSVLSAFPWVRNNKHNLFERHHRFIGWIGLLFTWFFVMLGNGYDDVSGQWDWKGNHVIRTQDFYFVLAMTIFIALPWIFTRKVKVDVEIPSSKVAVLRFERGMQQGLLGRISRTSILEYHAFGIISEGTHAKYHYMVCGVQGDFTRGLVENPPTHIWTREVKFAGVSNTTTIYKRGIRIATGTGIGAALSTCLQSKDWFLIWIGSDQEKTFGKTIAGLIENGIEPERRILWDTKKLKRPNTMKLLKDTFDSFGAEVVFITSNYGGNTEMMQGCKVLGMPCFGTLWDF